MMNMTKLMMSTATCHNPLSVVFYYYCLKTFEKKEPNKSKNKTDFHLVLKHVSR